MLLLVVGCVTAAIGHRSDRTEDPYLLDVADAIDMLPDFCEGDSAQDKTTAQDSVRIA